MPQGTCSVEGCGTHGRVRRGWCNNHYGHWTRHGHPVEKVHGVRPCCSVEDCDEAAIAKGYCTMHYRRVTKTGTTDPRAPLTRMSTEDRALRRSDYYRRVEKPRAQRRPCRVEGCVNSANKTADLCVCHHFKLKRYGDVHAVAPRFRTEAMREFAANYTPSAPTPCSIDGCAEPARQKTYCAGHYRTYRKFGHPLGEQVPRKEPRKVPRNASAKERFWAKVDIDGPVPQGRPELGPCWVWLAATDANGYGVFAGQRGFSKLAHRFSWHLAGRKFVDGRVLDHICKVHWCVRPDHLRQIGLVANVMIGDTPTAANRKKTHCKRGHLFDEANTMRHPNGRGRQCRACFNANVRDRARVRRALAKGAIAA